MARTVLTSQRLQTIGGQDLTFATFDKTNGHEVKNVGIQVVLVKLEAAASITIQIPSVADPFSRVGDISKALVGPIEEAFGPFVTPTIWGDGASKLFIDSVSGTGTIQVAVIEVG